jgi:hypothetical protein
MMTGRKEVRSKKKVVKVFGGGRAMFAMRWVVPIISSALISGCGLYVPEIQEFTGDKVTGQQLVQSIAYNVTCEVQDAIDKIYNNPDHPRKSTFLDSWGAQIALSIQVEEKSGANPNFNWLPPSPASAVFGLAGGGTLSADATRQDKLNSYYLVSDLRTLGPCLKGTRPGGVLLLQSDLGLEEWLRDNVTAADTGVIKYAKDYSDGPLKTNVLSHEIKFDITNTGNITAGWKLTRVSVNQSGNLLSATRDRTNDLTITLGPTIATSTKVTDEQGKVKTVITRGPAQPAQDAAASSQIGLAVSNAIKSILLP